MTLHSLGGYYGVPRLCHDRNIPPVRCCALAASDDIVLTPCLSVRHSGDGVPVAWPSYVDDDSLTRNETLLWTKIGTNERSRICCFSCGERVGK